MKTKLITMALGLLTAISLTCCGGNPELTKFKNEVDDFCTAISEIDHAINTLDAEANNAASLLLSYLDSLDEEFQNFAQLDFPEEFDYLEELADEAGAYMTEAVSSYHEAYENDGYDKATAEYAGENYSRAYKRIQIIITFLHGEEPQDADLVITTTE